MKKRNVAVFSLFVIIFAVSCNDKSKLDETSKLESNKTSEKQEKFSGQSVELNGTDFLIQNNFLYYKGNIYTGRVIAKGSNFSGYFTFKLGVLEGEFQINFASGRKLHGVAKKNKLISVEETINGVESGLKYDEEGKIASITEKNKKEKYSFSVLNDMVSGEIIRNGKKINVFNESEIMSEKDGLYIYEYTINKDLYGKVGSINEIKYKVDSKNYKYKIEVDQNTIQTPQVGITQDISNYFYDLLNQYSSNVVPTLNDISNVTTSEESAVTENANPVNNGDYLSLLDQVYNEVINKGNESYLDDFTSEQLGFLRNTIFAKKGYIFKTDKYRNYFSTQSWYKGISTSEPQLTSAEKDLVQKIQIRE